MFWAVPINSAVTPGAGAYGGFQLSSSDVRNLGDLAGNGLDFGAGGGDGVGGGIDLSTGIDPGAEPASTVTFTIGGGAGGTGKGLGPVFTFVTPICQ